MADNAAPPPASNGAAAVEAREQRLFGRIERLRRLLQSEKSRTYTALTEVEGLKVRLAEREHELYEMQQELDATQQELEETQWEFEDTQQQLRNASRLLGRSMG